MTCDMGRPLSSARARDALRGRALTLEALLIELFSGRGEPAPVGVSRRQTKAGVERCVISPRVSRKPSRRTRVNIPVTLCGFGLYHQAFRTRDTTLVSFI